MSQSYFSELNYTLANEDTRVEHQLLPKACNRVFSISGSGARCMPLIARNPATIDIVDMSVTQLYLSELRYQAMKSLAYDEYLFLLGYRGGLPEGKDAGDSRYDLFQSLKLSTETKTYWQQRKEGWQPRGFIFLGRWENHFQKIGKIFRNYLRCDFSRLFEAQTLDEQIEYYNSYWPHRRWKGFLRVAASEYVFNKYLYKGHFSGSSKQRTETRPPYQFVFEEFKRVFFTQLARKNYFMQTLFLGKILYEEGLPLEALPATVAAVKASNTQVIYHCGNLLELLPKHAYDFISLSDTISYIPQDLANNVIRNLHPDTAKGAQIVIRSFLRAPTAVDSAGWTRLSDKEKWAHEIDGTAVYQFHIFTKS